MNESVGEQCQFSDRDTENPTGIKLQPAWQQTGANPWAAGCGLVTVQSPKWDATGCGLVTVQSPKWAATLDNKDPPFPCAAATGNRSDKEGRTALEPGHGAKGAAEWSAPGRWFSNVRKIWSEILTRQFKIGL